MSEQAALFGGHVLHAEVKPAAQERNLRILITVKAAPNPSEQHGETVCVAGVAIDDATGNREWIRLYPINFRHLEQDVKFKKYDVVTVDCVAATKDQRRESWRPVMRSLVVRHSLSDWTKRRPWIDDLVEPSLCALLRAARDSPASRSLGLIRPVDVGGFRVTPHPGWTGAERAKIDAYVSQLELFDDTDKSPLEAPRFIGSYHWRCGDRTCGGHKTMTLDWEFVAFQRRLRRQGDAESRQALEAKFLGELCASDRDVAFYVGNQAKRAHTFSVLGVYWPRRRDDDRCAISGKDLR